MPSTSHSGLLARAKVSSLPDNLKSVAEELIVKKFGEPVKNFTPYTETWSNPQMMEYVPDFNNMPKGARNMYTRLYTSNLTNPNYWNITPS